MRTFIRGRLVVVTATLALLAFGGAASATAATSVATTVGATAAAGEGRALAVTGFQQPAAPLDNASGMPWNSGVFAQHSGSKAAGFGSWRNGRPVDNVVVFPTRDSWSELLNPWWRDALPDGFDPGTQDLVIGVPLWPEDGRVSGNYDSQWATLADQVNDTDGNAYVRLGWEMNIGWYWKVTAANRTAWIAAFKRATEVFAAHCPDCRIVFNPNGGPDDTDTDSRSVFQAVKSKVDVYAIDSYDEWPPDTSQATWENSHLGGERNLQDSYDYALANGKLFAVPEWGLGCTTDGCQWEGNAGGDNPRYINDYMDWFYSVRSALAFESYFNEPDDYIRSNLYPTSTNPKAAAAYRNKIAQYDLP